MKHYIEFCWGALLAVLLLSCIVVFTGCASKYESTGECSVTEFAQGQCPGKKDPFGL